MIKHKGYARMNFRQQEENHIMENIIYNELLFREFDIDIGVVEYNHRDADGKKIRSQFGRNVIQHSKRDGIM